MTLYNTIICMTVNNIIIRMTSTAIVRITGNLLVINNVYFNIEILQLFREIIPLKSQKMVFKVKFILELCP